MPGVICWNQDPEALIQNPKPEMQRDSKRDVEGFGFGIAIEVCRNCGLRSLMNSLYGIADRQPVYVTLYGHAYK